MDELRRILAENAEKYPLMQPQDAVKLIYQNEFGSGHMIRDVESCLDWLRHEYLATKHDPTLPLYEPIGNRIYRVNLAALESEDVEPLGMAFLRTAAECKGNLVNFLLKLDVLIDLAKKHTLSFTYDELETYLSAYAHAGYPAVSHSQIYRQAYSPAYRIVRK